MMKLSNIESRKLLPRFASKIAWLMDALDSIIKPISERVKSIDAPLTLEAIAALTDEELEALYDQYGVAQYYPDLSRSTRDLMLYEMCKMYRYLGTPHAIEVLCNYIFDNVPLNVHVLDNLAFDDQGTLINASLLDVFDIEVNPDLPVLSVDATARLLANIIRFSRNSQALRDIIYTFTENFELPVYPLRAGVPGISVENDAICEPVTPPAPAYTEITLYMQSGSKRCQLSVSSSFTGNVDSAYVYQLYTDEACTIPWAGYDYSNDYEVGHYVNSEWNRYTDSVSAMPSSTAIYGIGYILMDTGALWLCHNSRSSTSVTTTNIVVRIYPKGQQYYAAYVYGSAMYTNAYIGISDNKTCTKGPGSLQYIQTPHQFPHITLQKVLGAAGNEITATTFETGQGEDGTRFYVHNSGMREAYIRTVIYTLEYPVIGYWLKSDGTNISTSSGVAYPLMNLGGEIIEIDNNFDYFPIALIQHNGNFATETYSYLNNATMGAFDPDHPTRLCFKQVSGTLSLSYVQYYKKPKPIEVNFGDPVTIPAGYHVESVRCQRLYVKASNVSYSAGNPVTFSFLGENEFCDDSSKSLVGTGVSPCLSIYAISSSVPNPVSGYWMSYRSTKTPSKEVFSISASNLNSGGVFVEGTLSMTNGDADNSIIANALNTYPALFRRYDSNNTVIPYYFKIQQSLWQLQNGIFSWLGDTTDASSLAYWYNGLAVQIILAKDE